MNATATPYAVTWRVPVSVSNLDPAALSRLSPGELADMALSADQECRRLRRLGRDKEAAFYDREAERLCAMSVDNAKRIT